MSEQKRAWWKEAVVYQIYPRSFADSNGDGIGDLNGITAHLDYLKDLGVDAIWVSPIYASPNHDNGYDISDYRAIMKEFGTMEDFDRLLEETHRRGMKLIMDLVVNHSSDEHAWFVESRKSRDNPYRDYYIWKDGKDDGPPNNWGSCFSGSAWEKDEATGQYYLHLFTKEQPDLNWANPAVRDGVFEMMTWWCEKGIDGFRMDVIGMIGKENYNDGPVDPGALYGSFAPSCMHTEATHRYLQEMRKRVLDHYDLLTVGETSGGTENALRYASEDGSELNMVFGFEHNDGINDGNELGKWSDHGTPLKEIRAVLNRRQMELQGKAWNTVYLGNHDQPRQVSRYGNDSELFRTRSAKMLATMIHTLRGTPYVYQGEELGMTNIYFTRVEQYQDVEVHNVWKQWVESGRVDAQDMLRFFARIARDNARTPMQWNAEKNAGFSTGEPWLPVNKNYLLINAEDQINDPDSVWNYYRKLIALRHQYDIFVYGWFEPLLEDSDQIYAYRRVLDKQVLTVALNWTDRKVTCNLMDDLTGEELISNYPTHQKGILQPYEARVILSVTE
ncbi:MAG: alpha-glucosidase [Clostridia bacterium]|nr:alpha-glucosidase [Clostridia bacterium]